MCLNPLKRHVEISFFISSNRTDLILYGSVSWDTGYNETLIHLEMYKWNFNHFNHALSELFEFTWYKGSNTSKRARRKNLRHPRERFLVSNEALSSWRPIEIFPAGVWDFSVLPSYRCLILFLTNILLKVQYFPSWDTPYMKYDVTHILTSLKNDVKGTEKDI
jgi:hypothetical protein